MNGYSPVLVNHWPAAECLRPVPMAKAGGEYNTAVIVISGGHGESVGRHKCGHDRTCREYGLGAHPVKCVLIIHGADFRIAVPSASTAWRKLAALKSRIAAEHGRPNN